MRSVAGAILLLRSKECGAPSRSGWETKVLYVSDGDQILVFDAHGRRNRRSAFNGMPGGTNFAPARSFSNFDPAMHTGPAWRNVLPPEEPVRD